MLTARGEESDRIRGLDTGADDYVVKPFSHAGADGARPRDACAGLARPLADDPARSATSSSTAPRIG